jgi:hypothetical protein
MGERGLAPVGEGQGGAAASRRWEKGRGGAAASRLWGKSRMVCKRIMLRQRREEGPKCNLSYLMVCGFFFPNSRGATTLKLHDVRTYQRIAGLLVEIV